jgi:hypothetical protein
MYRDLLEAIRKGATQRDFVGIVGENESVVQRIVAGEWNPDKSRQLK